MVSINKNTIFLIVLLLVTGYLINNYTESFLVLYPINAFEIPESDNKTINDISIDINKILNGNTVLEPISLQNNVPYYHVFDLDNILKEYLSDYVTDLFSKSQVYKESKVDLIRKLYNMKWGDIGKDRHYLFNIDLLNSSEFFSFKLVVYLVITNLSDFELDKKVDRIVIKYIGIDETVSPLGIDKPTTTTTTTQQKQFDIKPYTKEDSSSYYRITNSLYLMT